MKHSATLLAAAAAVVASSTHPALRAESQSDGPDQPNVCYPDVMDANAGRTVPPCVEISSIESACLPRGTEYADYEAHAKCMCSGSYFADWRGCQNCLLAHGYRSERDNAYWENVLSVASDALCTESPTAAFSALFASAQSDTEKAPFATAGNSASSDSFPGQTEVGLYYTATDSQGPGAIAGASSSATADEQSTATGESLPSIGTISQGFNATSFFFTNPAQSTSRKPTASTAAVSSNAVAGPTHRSGLAMVIAGAALVAAL